MYEIDKEKFGAFVAELRKERGMTQKELAGQVYVSDKAVSKWERGLSMSDITLLIPISEALGVTVAELLECRRMEQAVMDSDKVEELVHRVITYSEETPAERSVRRKKERKWYAISFFISAAELYALRIFGYSLGDICLNLLTYEVLFFIFAGYFCFFAKDRLPEYYDNYKINLYSDGIFRMNMPGIYFNNRNWPYIKREANKGMLLSAVIFPILYFIWVKILPDIANGFVFAAMPLFFILMFVPMCAAARKYE